MRNNDNLELLDILNILSFVIGLMNYNENLTQGDKQELMQALNNQTATLLEEVHTHLELQDKKLDKLEELINETNTKVSKQN